MGFCCHYLVYILFCAISVTFSHRHGASIDLRHIGIPVQIQSVDPNQSSLFHDVINRQLVGDMSVLDFLKDGKYLQSESLSDMCMRDTDFLIGNVELLLKYVDATTKVPYGILQGKTNWVGDYQECNSIEPTLNSKTGNLFKGKYSTGILLYHGKPIIGLTPTILLGVCFPDSCNETDVKSFLDSFIDLAKQNFTIQEVFSDNQRTLESGTIGVLILTGIIVFIVLLATLVDYSCSSEYSNSVNRVSKDDDSIYDNSDRTGLLSNELFSEDVQVSVAKQRLLKVCQVFSLTSNGKKLFGTKTAVGPLACLNGMRVLSMWWVILGHSYGFMVYFMDNPIVALKIVQRFTFQPIINGTYSVDSFFFLSGLLVCYLALNEIRDKGKLSWPYYFLHRYWRLTPLYAYVILYYTFIYTYTIFGPSRLFQSLPLTSEGIDICRTKWWTNLLYINNMYPNSGNLATTCMGWGWYLANDMQFYLVLGPIFIMTLSLRGKLKYIGISLAIFLILVGIGIRGFIVWYYGIYAGLTNTPTKHVNETLAKNGPLYGRPYGRYSVYLVGMLTGYVLSITNTRIRLNRATALVGWCVAIATGLSVIYGVYYYNHHLGTHMTLVQSGFYMAIGRTAWSLCLAWIVIACVSGHGGPVKAILSWKIWAPLGRLTYAAYLVHPIVILTYNMNMVRPIYFTDLSAIYMFVSNLVFSYVVAFIVSMLVEAPMIQLEKVMLVPLKSLTENVKYRFRSNKAD